LQGFHPPEFLQSFLTPSMLSSHTSELPLVRG
jgi:hypothetical protein